jgi:hypothetical protein
VTIQDLGSIGDFLGGIGVVITLIYLAFQIRQNTNAVRATGAAASDDLSTKMALVLAQDSESRRVYLQGLQDYESLSEGERAQFEMLLGAHVANLNSSFKLYSHGAVDDDTFESCLTILGFLVSQPGFRPFWSKWGGTQPASLVARIDPMLAAAAEPPAAQQSTPPDATKPQEPNARSGPLGAYLS